MTQTTPNQVYWTTADLELLPDKELCNLSKVCKRVTSKNW